MGRNKALTKISYSFEVHRGNGKNNNKIQIQFVTGMAIELEL